MRRPARATNRGHHCVPDVIPVVPVTLAATAPGAGMAAPCANNILSRFCPGQRQP
jgi:hypothetical protein